MARTIGRRVLFFGILVIVSLALYFPTPPGFRWVTVFCAGLSGFWALMFAIEDLTGPTGPPPRATSTSRPAADPETPFGPPPPVGRAPRNSAADGSVQPP
jgi:hypothetical protein